MLLWCEESIYAFVYMYICIYIICTHVNMYICVFMYIYFVCVWSSCPCIIMEYVRGTVLLRRTYICIYVYMHIYAYTHICIYSHIYSWVYVFCACDDAVLWRSKIQKKYWKMNRCTESVAQASWPRPFTYEKESCHTYEEESCHTCEKESCHTHEEESCDTFEEESCHTYGEESCHVSLHKPLDLERDAKRSPLTRGGGLGSSTIFKKFNETYAPS